MATNKIFLVDELDASKTFVNMKVRIIRRWINTAGKLDMVLIDEKGKKIQATVKTDLIPLFDEKLKEDAVVMIKKFGVCLSDDKFLVVIHGNNLKMNFYKATQVSPDVTFNGHPYGFNFVPFDEIDVKKARDKDVLNIDLIGSVTWCGNLDIFKNARGVSKRFNFELKDLDNRRLKCTLWNDYAIQFNKFMEQNNSGEHVITILQHAKISVWGENITVQSDKFGTRVFINEDIQEAHDFRRRLILKEGASGTSQGTFTTQTVYPVRVEFLEKNVKRHIDEVIEADMEGECVVPATIALVESDLGWFYISCRKCKKKVLTQREFMEVANDDDLTDNLIKAPPESLWCPKEKNIVEQLVPRFRVTCRVQDSTGSASFVLWDTDVAKVLGLSANDIRERQQKNNDTESYPHELEKLVNVRGAFKIKIDKYNLDHKGSAYTVIKMCDDPELIDELLAQDNVNEVSEDHTIAEVSTAKLSESSQGGLDSKDAFSVTGDSSAVDVDKDTETSPLQKRGNHTPGAGSTTKGPNKIRKITMS